MLVGRVNQSNGRLVPLASLILENSVGEVVAFDAKIDTGFDGWLGLPNDYIEALGLEAIDTDLVTLADNQQRPIDVYTAEVIWGQQNQTVRTHRAGTMPLIGMSMLDGHTLTIDARNGGSIELTPTGDSGQ